MRAILSLLILTAAASLSAAPITPDDVFDLYHLHTIHLRLTAQDWKDLQPHAHKGQARPGAPSDAFAYVRAAADFDGQPIADLGIRLKGNSSYSVSSRSPRRPFKLDFDRFSPGRHFAGLSTLNLNNAAFDESQVRETFAFALFRELGVPAPRTGHALVYLTIAGGTDHQYLGLYTLIEEVDKRFLKKNFPAAANDEGLLLKPSGMRGVVYCGDNWSQYTSLYNPKSLVPTKLSTRLIETLRLINRADDATFRQRINQYFDVDEFLRYVAVNAAITNFDSYLSTGHNYYLYVNPADGRVNFLPWDMNLSFGAYSWLGNETETADCSITRAYADHNRLIERLLSIDTYAAMYRAHMRRLIDGPFSAERMRQRFETLAPVFAAAEKAAQDAHLAGSPATRPSTGLGFRTTDLRTYIARRVRSIRAQLDGKEPGYLPGFRDPQSVPPEWAPVTAAAVAIMNATDTDGDGRLSDTEISAAITRLLAADNLPPTGLLPRSEAAATIDRVMSEDQRRRAPATAWADYLFRLADKDKRGAVDALQLLAAFRTILANEDRDHDGLLDLRELIETLSGSRAPHDTQVRR